MKFSRFMQMSREMDFAADAVLMVGDEEVTSVVVNDKVIDLQTDTDDEEPVESAAAGEPCNQVLAWSDGKERGKCVMPAGHIGPHNFMAAAIRAQANKGE